MSTGVDDLTRRHASVGRLEALETALVRHSLDHPGALHPRGEAALRYALAIARLTELRDDAGVDVDVSSQVVELRESALGALEPLLRKRPPDLTAVARATAQLVPLARSTRSRLVMQLGSRLSPAALERELTHRALVLACGGGGGAGYGHLGAFALLESAGLRPQLISGASMGAILGLFRARALRFDVSQTPKIMGEVEGRHLFRPYNAESRWTLPSAVRLALRDGIGPYFEYDGVPLRLRDLPIPLVVTVAGIKRNLLSRSLVERLRGMTSVLSSSGVTAPLRAAKSVLETLGELMRVPDILENIPLGDTDETREFDVVDAAGLSSAVPGALHYELGRDAPTEVERLEALFAKHELFRVTDGGVTDNVPARTAWRAVQRGLIGTRNSLILALDGFSPRLSTGLWLPIQRLAQENVKRSLPYASHYVAFQKTLSPVELLPRADSAVRIIESAKTELMEDLPFLQRMLEPLPGVAALQ